VVYDLRREAVATVSRPCAWQLKAKIQLDESGSFQRFVTPLRFARNDGEASPRNILESFQPHFS
jgi:hypothetical protein